MEHTANYQLSQWSMADRIQMQDFNSDNQKIDAALAGHEAALTQLPKLGNCQIYTTTYTGTGQCGAEYPNTLTFPQKPTLVIIGLYDRDMLHIFPTSITYTYALGTSGASQRSVTIQWDDNTVSWYANNEYAQQNAKQKVYHVIALYAMD